MNAVLPSTHLQDEPLRSTSGVLCDVVINATPLGMKVSDALPIDPASLAPGTLVVDVIMEPATTELLRRSVERGLPIHPATTDARPSASGVPRFFPAAERR
ncbi:hypothetical protein LJR130_005955 [Variovorax sp. LjRoot130]|uniref:hypothetical protein n=1 Tax=Variovorax sp. LjRoot130 TaxID=3342261 RepID=UPI003ECFB929